MSKPTAVFFGSFLEYPVEVLRQLLASEQIQVIGVVTTPPQPAGRTKELKPTEVQIFAEEKGLTVVTPEVLNQENLDLLAQKIRQKPDIILTAGYGKLLPPLWLEYPTAAALNLHFSLLPKYRGANPAEWAMLMGETEIGVTLIEMSPEFDTGKMVAQAVIPLSQNDTRETVYQKLYALGGMILPKTIIKYLKKSDASSFEVDDQPVRMFVPPITQPLSPTPYAKRFQRDDGYIAWPAIVGVMEGQIPVLDHASPLLQTILRSSNQTLDAVFVERASRALAGFPSLWTMVPTTKGEKRMKILQAKTVPGAGTEKLILEKVQIEGQSPSAWNQVKNSILT